MDVSVGLATKLGLLGTIAASVTCVIESLQSNQALLTGQNKVAGILAFTTLISTKLGRMYQARGLTQAAGIAGEVAQVPEALAALAREAEANLTKVQASPDNPDSPQVPFAQASQEPPPPPAQG